MIAKVWNVGDVVMHADRPEWGVGKVTAAQKAVHEGVPCQRLTVRFESGGVKTLSTGLADLRMPEVKLLAAAGSPPSRGGGALEAGWLNEAEKKDPGEILASLPEAATDPFRSVSARLATCLGLYRFSGQGGSLIEWATAQTGAPDPLSILNRHELEAHFTRFRIQLDNQAKKLAAEVKRSDPSGFAQIVEKAPADAQRALRRMNILR
ncbi:MAG: DUF3553 domain-containing protein [Phycisphaeraceae bacterium]|nr:DUF3553 domain-containing protein [Phycisphaeraceae bacterium]MCW5754237.1 DUF3553 domain-containing protein [Phycisphaeraceae bacterium]